MFAIKQNEGAKEIQSFSTSANEAEAVFSPGTRFRIARILGEEAIPPIHRKIYQHVILLEKIIEEDL